MFKFDPVQDLVLGLVTGLVFGFLLQRGRLTRYRVIVGQFLFTDFTMLRTMITAVLVGAVGVWAMHQAWDVDLHVKGTHLAAQALGGALLAVGMVVLGYCPGTGVAAVGDGSRHALLGLLGMLAGAALYAETDDWIRRTVLPVGDLGKITLADLTGLSPWVFIASLAAAGVAVLMLVRKRDLSPEP